MLGIRNRFNRWLQRRAPLRAPPFRLTARTIYILPTRNGLYFAALVFVMLLGSMNYNNNLGFVLTFVLAAVSLVCMHHTQRNLLGLQIHRVTGESVTAGQAATFDIELANATRKARYAIRINSREATGEPVSLATDSNAATRLNCVTSSRGYLPCPRLRVETVYPMGLFRAWSWLAVDASVLIYPKPAGTAALPGAVSDGDEAAANAQPGDNEFAGHRAYATGDNPRRIDWKASARTDALIISRYTDNNRERELWLDAADLAHLPTEMRLSQLARWIFDAQDAGLRYGLQLPDETIAPAAGRTHMHKCLAALALQP